MAEPAAVGVVASDWLLDRLDGAHGRIVGMTPRAAYVEMAASSASGPWMLAIEDHRGVGLPCGVRLPAVHADVLGSVAVGAHVRGTGHVLTIREARPVVLSVVRWHRSRPAPPVADVAEVADRVAVMLDVPGLAGRWWATTWPDLDPVLATGVLDLVGLVTGDDGATPAAVAPGTDVGASHDRGAAVVGRLVGHGPGSTPAGDDLVAGFVATNMVFDPVGARRDLDGVVTAIDRHAVSRTTRLSATLLACAVDTAMAMPAAGFLQVVTAASTSPDRVRAAFDHLCRIGHTSGRDLALGTCAAVAARSGARAPSSQGATSHSAASRSATSLTSTFRKA